MRRARICRPRFRIPSPLTRVPPRAGSLSPPYFCCSSLTLLVSPDRPASAAPPVGCCCCCSGPEGCERAPHSPCLDREQPALVVASFDGALVNGRVSPRPCRPDRRQVGPASRRTRRAAPVARGRHARGRERLLLDGVPHTPRGPAERFSARLCGAATPLRSPSPLPHAAGARAAARPRPAPRRTKQPRAPLTAVGSAFRPRLAPPPQGEAPSPPDGPGGHRGDGGSRAQSSTYMLW